MDHLPNFGASETIEVPYLCTEMYDGGDFDSFPERKGWNLQRLKQGQLDGKSSQDAASFLQAFLYFGLLFGVFQPLGEFFNPKEFVRENELSKPVITTRMLGKCVIRWRDIEIQRSAEQRQQKANFLKSFFHKIWLLARRFCLNEPSQHQAEPHMWPLSPAISFSILVLGDSLVKAGWQILDQRFNIDWGASPMLVNRMKGAGWCMTAIHTLTEGQQIHNLYYASTLGPPTVHKNHDGCSEKFCKQEQVTMETYETQHRPDCNGCSFIGPDRTRLIELIESGRTPLVLCKELNGSLKVDVISDEGSANLAGYIAISHVWCDGLGNLTANALPICQLRHLQILVNRVQYTASVENGTPWWCDVLCIPVGEEDKKHRKAAMRNMGRIYQSSTKVLALDSGLVSISDDAPDIELYVRLRLSGWTRRLWTLQEGVLAKDVHIQCSSGTRTLRDIDSAMARWGQETTSLFTRYDHLARGFFNPFVRSQAQAGDMKLLYFWKSVHWRATSKRADETLCIATLLGLDPQPLLDIPEKEHSQRMVRLFQMIGSVPLVLLFQPPPRLSEPGFRWAPTSFLDHFRETPSAPFRVVQGTGQVDSAGKGLSFSRPGVEMVSDQTSPMPQIGAMFLLALSMNDETQKCCVVYSEPNVKAARHVHGNCLIQRPALIPLNPLAIPGGISVLVDIVGLDDRTGRLNATFIATVNVILRSMVGPHLLVNLPSLSGTLSSTEKQWLVL